jgi:hypothetical protein
MLRQHIGRQHPFSPRRRDIRDSLPFDVGGRTFVAALLRGALRVCANCGGIFQILFIALLKPPFKFSEDYRVSAGAKNPRQRTSREWTGEFVMARYEILDSNMAPLGEGPAARDMLFELGMMYSVGRDAPVDLVAAHKWFNLAAMTGNADAVRLRREIANQMSDVEIACAQRAARDWLRSNEPAPVPAMAA